MDGWPLAAAAAWASVTLGAWAPTANATVTFDYFWSDIQCGYSTTASGPATQGSCSSPSFSAVVQGGGSAFVTATLNYNYHDDGLALPTPVTFLTNSRLQVLTVTHEAAAIYFQSSNCTSFEACLAISNLRTSSSTAFFVLGNNDTPDTLSGSRTYTATVSVIPQVDGGVIGVRSFFTVAPVALATTSGLQVTNPSPTTPVPEPSTWALMALGLGAVAWARRRSAISAA